MFHLGMTAAFQNVQVPHQVSVCVRIRVFQRVAHAGLAAVDHAVKLFVANSFAIPSRSAKSSCWKWNAGDAAIQTCLLQADVIIVVHVVDSDNIMPFIQQALRDMEADKTCGTSDQKLHIFLRGVDIPFYISADFTLACGWDHLLCHDKICK